jgi:excisionase family DNA binding protein
VTDEVDGWQPGPPVLLTAEQAAEWCQVSREIIDEWSHEPGFPVLRRPRFVRIHREALDHWLKQRAIETNPPLVYEPLVPPSRARRLAHAALSPALKVAESERK